MRNTPHDPHESAEVPKDVLAAPDTAELARVRTSMFTLRHLIDSFEAHVGILVRSGENEPATLRWYQDQLKHLDALGDYPADALRTHHLAAIQLTNGFVRALKRLYKWATEEDLVPKDPFGKLKVPPCGQRERVLTRPEVCRLYRACSRQLRRMLFVQFHTLARPGEIRGLTWGQIDWANRVILIVKYKAKKRRRDKLKARAIPLPQPVLRMLTNMHRKALDKSPEARVFTSPRYGKPWSANGVRCAMRTARERAGLDEGDEPVVYYHLRHTGATNAIRADVSLKLVAEVLGHARTATTERYVHLNTADVVGTIDRISAKRPIRAG